MAKILCIDDYPMYGEMLGLLLEKHGGHQIRVESVPLSIKSIQDFNPDVIVVNLVRKLETLSAQGIGDFYADVEGAKALREIVHASQSGAIHWPIVITSLGVLEHDLPQEEGLEYVSFIEIPQKLDRLMFVLEKILSAEAEDSKLAPD